MTELDAERALWDSIPEIPADTAFFASDPAGARACLSLAALLRARVPGAQPRIHFNRAHAFETEYGLPVIQLERAGTAELTGATRVFCGTSHPTSGRHFELGALAAAAAAGIPSVSFVDHWTNFRLRFEAAEGGLVLPDEIWVMDQHARALAEADGLPRARLRVSGSPTLAYLARLWHPPRPAAEVRAALDAAAGPLVLYAPDPISLRDHTGAHGFDEVSAARDLAAALADSDATVILRLHPLQPAAQQPALAAAFADRGVRAVTPPAYLDGPELATVADVVVGFYSNFLLEARALGRAVVRYLPGPAHVDPLRHLVFGTRIDDAAALRTHLAALRPPGA